MLEIKNNNIKWSITHHIGEEKNPENMQHMLSGKMEIVKANRKQNIIKDMDYSPVVCILIICILKT